MIPKDGSNFLQVVNHTSGTFSRLCLDDVKELDLEGFVGNKLPRIFISHKALCRVSTRVGQVSIFNYQYGYKY